MAAPYTFPAVEGLTPEEQANCSAMVANWRRNISKNAERARHYGGHIDVARLDLGISIPPPIVRRLRRPAYMWCSKAVDALADCSTFDGFAFLDDEAPEGFEEAMAHIDLADKYEQAKASELIHCAVLWTVTPGDPAEGEPPVLVNCYDMLHSSFLWDYRHDRVLCAIAVTDTDPKNDRIPTAVTYFGADSTVECWKTPDGWKSERLENKTGRPLAEPMRYSPDLSHPMGRSRIKRSIMQLEDNANRDAVRLVMHTEVYTAPTRWVMGADDDIFDNGRWEAYLGSIFALSRDGDGNAPTTGSYPVGDVAPIVSSIRQWANSFASEASVPVHELLYTEANPASAEAMNAAENPMVKCAERMNKHNGAALVNVGKLICSLVSEKPVGSLPPQAATMKAKWKNPAHPSISVQADAAAKISANAPAFPMSRVYWEMQGFDEPTTDRIMADLQRAESRALISSAMTGRE